MKIDISLSGDLVGRLGFIMSHLRLWQVGNLPTRVPGAIAPIQFFRVHKKLFVETTYLLIDRTAHKHGRTINPIHFHLGLVGSIEHIVTREHAVTWEPLLEVSVSHYTTENLYQAYHTNELNRLPETFFNLDLAQCGLGGNSCGPRTLDKYLVPPGAYHFSILLRPFAKNDSLRRLAREWVQAA